MTKVKITFIREDGEEASAPAGSFTEEVPKEHLQDAVTAFAAALGQGMFQAQEHMKKDVQSVPPVTAVAHERRRRKSVMAAR